MPNILLAIPTYCAFLKYGILERHLEALKSQTARDQVHIVWLVNNTSSEDLARFKAIIGSEGEVNNFGPMEFPDGLERLWNFARELAILYGYEYLWIVGGDNRPIPETHLETLLRIDKDVVASPCFLKDAMLPATNIFDPDRHDNFQPYVPAHELPLNQSFAVEHGMGTASILIKRKVFEAIKFRSKRGTICFIDYQFSEDILKHGFDFWSTTEIWVNHCSEHTGNEISLATDFPILGGEYVKWRDKLNWGWRKYAM